ncbi:MAG: hypothetical protein OEZ34_09925, partial [Spirochaetia bacterium]|nr:hypothetical protein [Spirochaetia bacterium]
SLNDEAHEPSASYHKGNVSKEFHTVCFFHQNQRQNAAVVFYTFKFKIFQNLKNQLTDSRFYPFNQIYDFDSPSRAPPSIKNC